MAYEEQKELHSPAQWKAVSHPLRLGILRVLSEQGEQTNEELAKSLGEASGKLYFHTRRLLEAGLIEAAGTRQKGPLTEKLYRATAKQFVVPYPTTNNSSSEPPLTPLLTASLELYQNSWAQTGGLPGETHLGFHLVLPQSAERVADFAARLRTLFTEFQETNTQNGEVRTTSFSVLLHTFPTANPSSTINPEEAK